MGDKPWICPNCNLAAARMPSAELRRIWPRLPLAPQERIAAEVRRQDNELAWTAIRVDVCLSCREAATYLVSYVKEPPHADVIPRPVPANWRVTASERLISPRRAPRNLADQAPDTIRSLFEEASVCENAGAMRAAGVLLRAAVEDLVTEQGATGGTLFHKIDSLKTSLPADLIADLHEARMLGNDSIHSGIAYDADEVADVAALIEEAVYLLYVQPAEKEAMRARRQARRDGR